MPEIKRRYIDTGVVRFIFRDFPTSDRAMRGAVAARCVDPNAYYAMLDALFRSVVEWSSAPDVDAALQREAVHLGLGSAAFLACLTKVVARVWRARMPSRRH